jgi:sulfatase maturation enzyme AslB (radical SAM superfamily)
MVDIARSANASIAFNPVCPSGRGREDDMMPCKDYFANMLTLQEYEDVCIRKGFEYKNGRFNEKEDCPVRKGTAIFVSHNGDCYPCGFLEMHKGLCMGNLVKLNYDLNKVFQHYPDECRKITAECASCGYYLSKNCFAGCPARIFACNNTFDAREKYCTKEYDFIN